MFIDAAAFNQDISSWRYLAGDGMNPCSKDAAAFYQDITGWSTTSLTTSTGMFYRRHRVARSSPARRRNRNLTARSASGSISRA